MPKIVINEQEDVSLASFELTENTVLVPILYARDHDSAGEPIGNRMVSTLFTSASKFKTAYANRHVWTDDNMTVPDKSYVMIYELLLQGMSVAVKPIEVGDKVISEDLIFEALELNIANGCLDEFKDRNIWPTIKFITNGAYPNCGLISGEGSEAYSSATHAILASLAADRGDAIALVEFRKELANLTKDGIIAELSNYSAVGNDKFANAMFPWCNFTTSVMNSEKEFVMPGSFAYLMAYANSVKTNANWFAAAGVIRGQVPNLVAPLFDVGEDLMHILQGDEDGIQIVVNPVFNAGTYGYRIWGNKVMLKSSSVTDNMFMNYLNVRVLLCDIKKQVYHAAMRTTFEPNDDIVWINFKTLANTLLEKMKSGRGITWYKWVKEVSADKGTIKATLYIRPIEAVDTFIINVCLTEGDASVEEATV